MTQARHPAISVVSPPNPPEVTNDSVFGRTRSHGYHSRGASTRWCPARAVDLEGSMKIEFPIRGTNSAPSTQGRS